jgi:hypothetical protein
MARSRGLTVIAVLAFMQGLFVTLVALVWFAIVSIFDEESVGMSTILVRMAEARGWFLIFLSLMYILFAVGAWKTRAWAWWVGLLVSVLSMLILVRLLLQGEPVLLALIWLIVPIIIFCYLFTPEGRQAFGRLE